MFAGEIAAKHGDLQQVGARWGRGLVRVRRSGRRRGLTRPSHLLFFKIALQQPQSFKTVASSANLHTKMQQPLRSI